MPSFLALGEDIAGYRLESFVGRGGMAVVYRALDLRLGRHVALKVLAPELAENEMFRQRFTRESKLAAAIDHPNIIPIFEAGEASDLLYIVMRYVDGMDLKALLEREGQLEPTHAVDLFVQVAGALDAAHARGLVHRDVKPGNILVESGHGAEHADHVYLTDFGVTKNFGVSKNSLSITDLTTVGHFVGTIDYVAPEQISSKPVDGRADIYALGCLMFQSLAGALPFERDDDAAMLWAHLIEPVPPLTSYRPELPVAVNDVFYRAMAKSPDDRYPTCRAVVAALRTELASWHAAGSGPPLTLDRPASGAAPAEVVRSAEPVSPVRPAAERAGSPPEPAEQGTAGGKAAAKPGGGIFGPARRRRLLLLAALAVPLLLVAGVVLSRVTGGTRFARFAGTDQSLAITLERPASWHPEAEPSISVLLSPHDLSDLFNGLGWAQANPLLAKSPGSLVGVYAKRTDTGFDTADPAGLRQSVATSLRLYGNATITGEDPRVAVDGRWVPRFDGVLSDPQGSGRLQFSYYVVRVSAAQQVILHVMTFGAPGTFQRNRSVFDRVINSLDVDRLATS